MSNVETIKVVPARYPLRAAGAVVALFVLAVVIQSVAFNPRWEWAVFARWFFDPVILEGVGQTLLLTLISTVLSSTTRSLSACLLPALPGAALKPSTFSGSFLPPSWG